MTHTKATNERLEAKRKAMERREIKNALEAIKSRSEWLKDVQTAFNQYIRLRDSHLPCISCGRFHQGQWHAGHYRSVGAAPHLRFDESNVHKQCAPCNNHKSGNVIEYRIRLVEKIGVKEVERIESDNKAKNYTIDELRKLKEIYKAKIKDHEKSFLD